MNTVHDREHEEWLARMLSGDAAVGAEEASERLAACPKCRAEVDALHELGARLDAAGVDAREDLRAAAGIQAPGEERVPARLTELSELRELGARLDAAGTDARADLVAAGAGRAPGEEHLPERLRELAAPPKPSRPRVAVWLAAAAACLLAAFLAWRALERAPAPEPLELGDEQDSDWTLVSPVGASDYREFAWKYAGAAGGYTLLIYDSQAGPGSQPLEISCSEPSWTPTDEERASLPDRINWKVEARGLSGKRDDVVSPSPSASAWR